MTVYTWCNLDESALQKQEGRGSPENVVPVGRCCSFSQRRVSKPSSRGRPCPHTMVLTGWPCAGLIPHLPRVHSRLGSAHGPPD